MKKMFALTVLTTALTAVCGEPVNYWNVNLKGDVLKFGNLKLDDGSVAAWTNGNWLIAGSAGYPDSIGSANYRGMDIGSDISAYGIRYKSGSGEWTGAGTLSVGPGGYDATGSWDASHTFEMKSVHLETTQRWYHPCGVIVMCPVTAAEGTVWTLTSDKNAGYGRKGFQFGASSDLSGVTVVLQDRERLSLMTAEAELRADVLRLEGPNTKLYYKEASGNTLDRRYAKTLELTDGAVATFTVVESTDDMGSDYHASFTNVIYDIDAISVVSGTVALGDVFDYAVKDGATLPIAIAAGATLRIDAKPTEGLLALSGAGTAVFASGVEASVDITDFEGTVQISENGIVNSVVGKYGAADMGLVIVDSVLRIDDVTGYNGTITLKGATRVALPRTADWPSAMRVVVEDKAVVYLPAGEAVDETKISGAYKAVGRGQKVETAPVTVGKGEELVICGDGFTADTVLTLDGGLLSVPFDVVIGAAVKMATNATIIVDGCATATASGAWEWKSICTLFVSNVNETVGTTVRNGRLTFTGTGTVDYGERNRSSISLNGGDLIFAGESCIWHFAPACAVFLDVGGRYLGIMDGAQVFFDGLEDYRWDQVSAMSIGGNKADRACLEVGNGSLLSFGTYRVFELGSCNAECVVNAKISGGIVRLIGADGSFQTSGFKAQNGGWATIKGDKDDRSPMVNIAVTDGGVIETDRVFALNPVTHINDREDYMAGVFLTLDGGTYKAGSGFGVSTQKPNVNTQKSRNMLFAGVDMDNQTYPKTKLDYTAEIQVTVGANGGTFDISDAQAGVESITNAIVGVQVPCPTIEGGLVPTLGPRWVLEGCLNVKGRGNQEFVVNGLESGALKKLRADGVTVKVISDSDVALDEMTIGASAGGLVAESSGVDAAGRNVAVDSLLVAEGGLYDASMFDVDRTIVQNVLFGKDATLYVRGNPVPLLHILGTVSLPSSMKYLVPPKTPVPATVISAREVVVPEGGVTWTQVPPTRTRQFAVGSTDIRMLGYGTSVIIR